MAADAEHVCEHLVECDAIRLDRFVLQSRLDLVQVLDEVLHEAVTGCLLRDPPEHLMHEPREASSQRNQHEEGHDVVWRVTNLVLCVVVV